MLPNGKIVDLIVTTLFAYGMLEHCGQVGARSVASKLSMIGRHVLSDASIAPADG